MLGTISPEVILINCEYEFLFLNYHEIGMGPIVAYDRCPHEKTASLAIENVPSEDSDQIARTHSLT